MLSVIDILPTVGTHCRLGVSTCPCQRWHMHMAGRFSCGIAKCIPPAAWVCIIVDLHPGGLKSFNFILFKLLRVLPGLP